MIKPGHGHIGTAVIFAISVLAASGCATKKYVNSQIDPLNQRMGQFEKQTNDRLAWLNNKQQSDMAQVNAEITATNQKVAAAWQEAKAAKASADQVNQVNSASRSTEEMEITNAAKSAVNSAMNYRLINRADITFGFDRTNLSTEARQTLDEVVNKYRSAPRAVIELAGFTDPIGSSKYNLDLSRRRAWAVQRYLVDRKVPLRAIHVVGMGEETLPQRLEAETSPGISRKAQYQMDRRVNIRVYGAGEIAGSSGSDQ